MDSYQLLISRSLAQALLSGEPHRCTVRADRHSVCCQNLRAKRRLLDANRFQIAIGEYSLHISLRENFILESLAL